LDVDGIYRVSGNLATIQKLRFIVNQVVSGIPALLSEMDGDLCTPLVSRRFFTMIV
ncbi:ARHGAP15 isoform 4, partial [Pongo abelii]